MPITGTAERRERIQSILENMHAMRRGLIMRHLPQPMSITPSQWAVLATVMRREDIGVKEVAKDLGVTPSAATQLIDELVNKKYLVRVQSNKDRRALLLRLSSMQKKKLGEMKAARLGHFIKLFSHLSDAELSQYAALNEKIAKSISLKIKSK